VSRFLSAFEGLLAGGAFALADELACGFPLDTSLPLWIAASGLLLGLIGALVGGLAARAGVGTAVVVLLAHALQWGAIASKEWRGSLAPDHAAAVFALLGASSFASAISAALLVHGTLSFSAILLAPALVPASSFYATFAAHAAWPGLAFAFAPSVVLLLAVWIARRGGPIRLLTVPALMVATFAGALNPWITRPPAREHARPPPSSHRPGPESPDLLLVIVDTLRADHVRHGKFSPGTPALDQLATNGIEFTQAIASAAWTLPSHGSLFTGRAPADHGAVTVAARLRDDVPTLAQVLHDAGYQTAAFTGGGFVVAATGLDRGFDEFDSRAEMHDHVLARHTPLVLRVGRNRFAPFWPVVNSVDASGGLALGARHALEWMKRRDLSRPCFLVVHTYQVHDYYLYQARWDDAEGSFTSARPRFPKRFEGRLWVHPDEIADGLSADDVESLRRIYAHRVALVDAAIGSLIEQVQAESGGRPLVIAVTSDHGEGFDAADHRLMHGGRLQDDLLRVPLLLALPGGPAGVAVDQQVRLVDLMPTLLDCAGVQAPDGLEGASLRALVAESDEPNGPRVAWSEDGAGDGRRVCVRTPRWKLVQRGATTEAFDLAADPLERRSIPDQAPPALRARLEQLLRDHPVRPSPDAALNDAAREQLRLLGYVR
jgi:arylsulfatase A-like enzyme